MQYNPKDSTAPRTASSRFSTAGFDCELPDGARDELVAPRRPRILGRPVKASHGLRRLVLALLVLVVLAAIVVIAFWSWQRSLPHPAPVAPNAPAVSFYNPTPTSIPRDRIEPASLAAWRLLMEQLISSANPAIVFIGFLQTMQTMQTMQALPERPLSQPRSEPQISNRAKSNEAKRRSSFVKRDL
jgi:hypothetical protein